MGTHAYYFLFNTFFSQVNNKRFLFIYHPIPLKGIKSTWKQIKSFIQPNKINKRNIINIISENPITYQTKHDIANVLNSYFVNISESMNARPYDHYQYLKGNSANSLFFAPVSSKDVKEIIFSLRNKPGNINTFSTSVLKRIWHHVSHVLCHIINLSLCTVIFPDCLKLAKVTPIPKGGDSTNAGNYRPKSVLPIFSNIFEKVVYKVIHIF